MKITSIKQTGTHQGWSQHEQNSTEGTLARLSGKAAWQQEGLAILPQELRNELFKFMNYMKES